MTDPPPTRNNGEGDLAAPGGQQEAERERTAGSTSSSPARAILSLLFGWTVGLGQEDGVTRTEPLVGWRRLLGLLVIVAFVVAGVLTLALFARG
jgi:hypothetical protein